MASWKASKSAIHSRHGPWDAMSTLLNTRTMGSLVLYSTLHAWSMLLMKTWGALQLAVSTTKATTVRKVEARDSAKMVPDADQVKISICPAVSTTM